MDVAAWLRNLGLQQYEHAFNEHGIDAAVLPHLTAADLRELRVELVGHRRKLLTAIAALADVPPSPGESRSISAASEADSPAHAERRHLTVMFSDLVDSTELATRLDPEDFRDIIRECQERITDIVSGFGGFVARYMGDGSLVYFGYPEAHEDDPERAVRAGLAAVQAVGSLELIGGYRPQVRVGIATGLVVVGDTIGAGLAVKADVAGEPPNLAARLQAVAEPNTVLIARETRQLLGSLFRYYRLPPLRLKGFDDSVSAFRVLGRSAVQSRFEALRPSLTPLVGRTKELSALLACWNHVKAGSGQVVLLSGEAGIGKSRMIAALQDASRNDPHIRLRYFCSPFHTDSAFYPIVRQIEHAAGIQETDTAEAKLKKIEAIVADPDHVELVAELLTIGGPNSSQRVPETAQRRRERTLRMLLSQLETLAKQKPVMVVFEDVHWIDPSSRELLDLVIERVPRLSALLAITFRPEFRPTWLGRSQTRLIALGRLSSEESSKIVEQTAGKQLPAGILEQIVSRSDGMPIFVEEMTKTVIASASLQEQPDRYVLRLPVPTVDIPTSLHGSLIARLDRLSPVRELAQIAATIGPEFSYGLLAAVSGTPHPRLQEALALLCRAELLRETRQSLDKLYRFKHALVRDAVYGTLLRERRRKLHARIGAVLESQFQSLTEAQPDLLAHHFTEAGVNDKAVHYWIRAGRRAISRSAMPEAISLLQRGLALVPRLPDTVERQRGELELQIALGNALIAANGFTAPVTGEVYERAGVLCEQLGDVANFIRVAVGKWSFYLMRAEMPRTIAIAEDLLGRADRNPHRELRLCAHRLLGITLLQVGSLHDAHSQLEAARHLITLIDDSGAADLAGFRDAVVGVPAYHSILLALLGRYRESRRQSENALALARREGRPHRYAFALGVAGCWFSGVLNEDAAEHEEEFAKLAESQEFPFWAAFAVQFRGLALMRAGDTREGLALVREGAARHRAMGSIWAIPYFFGVAADLAGGEEGSAILEEAQRLVTATAVRWFEPELHRIRGDLLARDAKSAAAIECYRYAVAEARSQGSRHWELRATLSLARMCHREDPGGEARALLEPVHSAMQGNGETPDLRQCRAFLMELGADV